MASIKLTVGGHDIEITTERSESSYGQPVVVVDGAITDTQAVCDGVLWDHVCDGLLSQMADGAGIHVGPKTRADLRDLAKTLLPGSPRGADYDRVIDEFRSRGKHLHEAEVIEEITATAMTSDDFRALRESLGLTQMEIAVKLDVTITTVSRWENGHVTITEPRALWIRDKLGQR